MPRNIDAVPFTQISDEAFRALTAVEMCMKNHEAVDLKMIRQVSRVRCSLPRLRDIIRNDLIENKLLRYDNAEAFSRLFSLSQRGYDYLALRKFCKSDRISHLGNMIGTGKESVIYLALAGPMCGIDEEDEVSGLKEEQILNIDKQEVIIKFHRLGHQSFKSAKSLRQYHRRGGRNPHNWFYLARLAAQREYKCMKLLHFYGLPIPRPLGVNRDAVIMEYLRGYTTLNKVRKDDLTTEEWNKLYLDTIAFTIQLAEMGLIHGDLNEFNLMVLTHPEDSDVPDLKIIDFPQMISRDHSVEAQIQYERDINELHAFFHRRGVDIKALPQPPNLLADIPRKNDLDVRLRLPGYIRPGKDTEEDESDASELQRSSEDSNTASDIDPAASDEDEKDETLQPDPSTMSIASSSALSSQNKKPERVSREEYMKKLHEKTKKRESNRQFQKDASRQMRANKKKNNRQLLGRENYSDFL